MNSLQKKEFELLQIFINICEELGLKYYLACGSALGAAKYNGFIPWDDDVDVAMMRSDYEVFLEKASELLPKNIFLQNYKTDPAFPQIFSKLRNSETTYIEQSSAKLPINHGIYIDVFPLDGYPTILKEQQILERRKKRYKRQLSCAFHVERNLKNKIIYYYNRFRGCHKRSQKIVAKYVDMISQYDVKSSELICNHGNWQGVLEYAPKWQYGDGIWMEFEDIKVRIPEKYDAYLTQKYGDWREDLPIEEQIGHHYYIICDVERSYTEYLY